MVENQGPLKGHLNIILILFLCLLVFMGLLAVENTICAYSNSPGIFPRLQLPAAGEYQVSFRGGKVILSGMVTVGSIDQEPDGIWLQVGQRKIYFPTRVALLSLP